VPFFPTALIPSFLLARAGLAVADDPQDLGGRRWLLYPPLFLVYVALAITLIALPTLATLAYLDETGRIAVSTFAAGFEIWLGYLPWTLVGIGIWWGMLGLLTRSRPAVLRSVFFPFLEDLAPRHGTWLVVVGLLALVTGVAVGFTAVPWSSLS
jgi:hypothetical protein